MTELLPCPFCGGEAKLYSVGTGSPHYGHYHQVVCQGCLTASGAYWSGEQSAIDAWNTRAERTCHDIKPQLPYFKCDVCGMADMGGGEIWISDGFYRGQKPNYCPNCGAKVVEQ